MNDALLEVQDRERRALTERDRAARRRSNIRFLIVCAVLVISLPVAYFSPLVPLLVAGASVIWMTFERRASLRRIVEDRQEREALDEAHHKQWKERLRLSGQSRKEQDQ